MYLIFTCSSKVNSLSVRLGLSPAVLCWWHSEATDVSDKSIIHRIIFQLHHLAWMEASACCYIILVEWPRSLSGVAVSKFHILTGVSDSVVVSF